MTRGHEGHGQLELMTRRQLLVYSYISCAALAVGSLGPWAYGPLGYSGASGDGLLVLSAAGLVALVIWRWTVSRRRPMLIVAQIIAGFCTAIAIYDIYDVYNFYAEVDEFGPGQVGWGLILTLIAAAALTALCFFQYRRSGSQV